MSQETEALTLRAALRRLPERERRVLIGRYGLDGRKDATLADRSRELGISRERVRQIQLKAIQLLKTKEYEDDRSEPEASLEREICESEQTC